MPITEDVGHIWGEIISQGAILGLSAVTFMHLFLKAILLQVSKFYLIYLHVVLRDHTVNIFKII